MHSRLKVEIVPGIDFDSRRHLCDIRILLWKLRGGGYIEYKVC